MPGVGLSAGKAPRNISQISLEPLGVSE